MAKLTTPIVLELIDTKTGQWFECPKCGMDWFETFLNSGENGKGGRWYDRAKRSALTAMYRPDGRSGLDDAAVECGCFGWWRVTGDVESQVGPTRLSQRDSSEARTPAKNHRAN